MMWPGLACLLLQNRSCSARCAAAAAAAAGKFRSGGPEALHQLHQEINKLYLDNQVGIS